jgi:hypothetical protein
MATFDFTLLLEQLKQSFYYKDGNLHWKNSSKGTKQDALAGWEGDRCRTIEFKQKNYKAHRLIFLLHYGYLPKYIDHIDGNPRNNKIENLREATHQQNSCNTKLRKDNTSGYKGVSFKKELNKWLAQSTLYGKNHYLGIFVHKEDAISAAKAFREANHKDFARHC